MELPVRLILCFQYQEQCKRELSFHAVTVMKRTARTFLVALVLQNETEV